MKTGVIFYVAGEHPISEGMEAMDLAKKLGIHVDRAMLVSRTTGYESVVDAWWALLTKGMKCVMCCVVTTQDGENFKLTAEPLRLCG